jgi:hypothetical protein
MNYVVMRDSHGETGDILSAKQVEGVWSYESLNINCEKGAKFYKENLVMPH